MYGAGNTAYTTSRADTLTKQLDTVSQFIPKAALSTLYGVRAAIVATDGVHTVTVDVSRQVECDVADEVVVTAMKWIPVRVTAEIVDTTIMEVYRDLTPDKIAPWTYDTTVFRLFRWYPYLGNVNDTSKWVEYSTKSEAVFAMRAGRLQWVKSKEDGMVRFGKGATTSLKRNYGIPLSPKNWTDLSTPFKFNIMLHDILDATGPEGDSLQIYEWRAESTTYVADPVFIGGIRSLTGERNTAVIRYESLNDALTIYNPFDSVVIVQVPPVPVALSKQATSKAKMQAGDDWNVALSWKFTESNVKPMRAYCGYAPGLAKPALYPMPPRFGNVGVGILQPGSQALYGHVMLDRERPLQETSLRGFAYEVHFFNEGIKDVRLWYRIEDMVNVPAGMEVALVEAGKIDNASVDEWHAMKLEGKSVEYRWVVVGSRAYINDFAARFKPFALALNGAYPNPSRGTVHIRYTTPYTGLQSLRFEIVDLSGRSVWQREIAGPFAAGAGHVAWNGRNSRGEAVPSGVYIVHMYAHEKGSKHPTILKSRLTHIQ
jgi:hypothetical protein